MTASPGQRTELEMSILCKIGLTQKERCHCGTWILYTHYIHDHAHAHTHTHMHVRTHTYIMKVKGVHLTKEGGLEQGGGREG